MLRAVIFDLDGVLVDSTQLQLEANDRFIESFGKVYSRPQSGREGMRIIDIVGNYKDIYELPGSIADLYQKRQQIFFDLARRNLEIFPGVEVLFEKLKQRSLQIALSTSGDKNYVELILKKFPQLANFFTAIVTGDDVLRGKPYPDIYIKTLEKLGIGAHEAVVVEDSVNGITSAKAAHLSVICIPNKQYTTTGADYSQADKVFTSLQDVFEAIP